MNITFSAEQRSPSHSQIIHDIKNSINNPAPSIFNSLHLLLYETLLKHYDGTFLDANQVIYCGPTAKRVKFTDSVFFQMYQSDKGMFDRD